MRLRGREVFRGAKPPSRLERRFAALWRAMGGPELEREFRFEPTRRWRADFAHLPSRTLIEIEGGIYIHGRHTRAAGFAADIEKYLEATLASWRVIRLGPDEINFETVGRIRRLLDAAR